MPNIFDTNSVEGKILLLLVEVYPITDSDIAEYLKIPKKRIDSSLRLLAKKGLIRLEPLPDVTYVSLASGDFQFKGRETEQLKKVREKLEKRKLFRTEDDYAGYG